MLRTSTHKETAPPLRISTPTSSRPSSRQQTPPSPLFSPTSTSYRSDSYPSVPSSLTLLPLTPLIHHTSTLILSSLYPLPHPCIPQSSLRTLNPLLSYHLSSAPLHAINHAESTSLQAKYVSKCLLPSIFLIPHLCSGRHCTQLTKCLIWRFSHTPL